MKPKAEWSHASVFDAHPASVPKARDFVEWHLEAHGRSGVADDVRLIVSELATNAVVHGDGVPFTVSLEEVEGSVRVAVHDDGGEMAAPCLARPELVETGRGLIIVEAVSAAWGVSADASGSKSVWASVEVTGAPEPVGAPTVGARR
jgi:anti-sigma regulatory factor (Ser/Thr protein kinase)